MGTDATNRRNYPSLHDHVVRIGLRLSKRGRRRYRDCDPDFYEEFFNEKHVDEAKFDLRSKLRKRGIVNVLSNVFESSIGSDIGELAPEKKQSDRLEMVRPTALDVGTGVGDVINSVPRAFRRIGISYTIRDLKIARSFATEDVEFVRGSATALPFASESIDVVLLLEVLEHLQAEATALREIVRTLRPGGLLVISVPSHYYFPVYLELIGHYRHYTRSQLTELLNSVGVSVHSYIDQHHALNRIHYYCFMALASLDRGLNRCGLLSRSLYARTVIGRIYAGICWLLLKGAKEQSQEKLKSSERSTFVVGRKKADEGI